MSTIDLRSSRATPWRDLLHALGHLDPSWADRARRAATLLLTWHARSRQRRQLECLSDHMLRDIGLTRADVLAESSKPFWRS